MGVVWPRRRPLLCFLLSGVEGHSGGGGGGRQLCGGESETFRGEWQPFEREAKTFFDERWREDFSVGIYRVYRDGLGLVGGRRLANIASDIASE